MSNGGILDAHTEEISQDLCLAHFVKGSKGIGFFLQCLSEV